MTHRNLPKLRPLSNSDFAERPALLVDEAADPDTLYVEAECRLSAARDLLFTVTLAAGDQRTADSLDGRDVASVAHAAQLLASDALDLMAACNKAHEHHAHRTAQHFHRHQEA